MKGVESAGTSKGRSSFRLNPRLDRAKFRGCEVGKIFGDWPKKKPMKGGGETLER